jgi:hypothetical protein
MNCRESRERIVDRFDVDGPENKELAEHLANCAECRSEFEGDEQVWRKIRPAQRIVASPFLRLRTMAAIVVEADRETAAAAKRRSWLAWPKWALVAAAALLLAVLAPLGRRNSNGAGIALLAQSVQAMERLHTVHIIGRMRSPAGDNFETIGAEYDFLPLEMWRQYGSPERWRVEKPGRVVVRDGEQSLLYISKTNEAMKAGAAAGFVEWLRPLLDPSTVLADELEAARQGKAQARVTKANGELALTITRRAQGDFANDWLKNKAIDYADHVRVYHFEAATMRLTKLKVVIRTGGRDVTVLELTRFVYDEALPPALFPVELPADVTWLPDAKALAPAAVNLASAHDAAAFFFDALSREDWKAVQGVLPASDVSGIVKQQYGGLKVVRVGAAFRSGLYPGWFVPYEVRLRTGESKHSNLAVRNDNPQKRWIVDGGF